jgi:hypothetical protein
MHCVCIAYALRMYCVYTAFTTQHQRQHAHRCPLRYSAYGLPIATNNIFTGIRMTYAMTIMHHVRMACVYMHSIQLRMIAYVMRIRAYLHIAVSILHDVMSSRTVVRMDTYDLLMIAY